MNNLYISKDANRILTDYLEDRGYNLEYIHSNGIVDKPISNHPDIFMCKMGIGNDSPICFATNGDIGFKYPDDVPFNAACTGKYFIHNLSHTNPLLLQTAKDMGMTLIDVKQGYAKCSIAVIGENTIITYDDGIVKACSNHPELKVLKISPGYVKLDGYNTGFIGGTCGRIGQEIVFNGDLSSHPNFDAITTFIEAHGLTCKWFPEYPLTDIGSIL